MGVLDQLIQFSNDLQEYTKDIQSGKFINEVAKECVNAIADDIDYIFTTCIDEFYNSYSPKYYKRTGSLYDIYDVSISGTIISWTVPYMYPGGHRVGGEFIYNYVFEGGYHGGAPSGKPDMAGNPHPGYMAWRTPPPSFGNHPYTFWGNPAVHSPAPGMKIGRNVNLYKNNAGNISGHTPIERVREAFAYVNLRYSIFNWV